MRATRSVLRIQLKLPRFSETHAAAETFQHALSTGQQHSSAKYKSQTQSFKAYNFFELPDNAFDLCAPTCKHLCAATCKQRQLSLLYILLHFGEGKGCSRQDNAFARA